MLLSITVIHCMPPPNWFVCIKVMEITKAFQGGKVIDTFSSSLENIYKLTQQAIRPNKFISKVVPIKPSRRKIQN